MNNKSFVRFKLWQVGLIAALVTLIAAGTAAAQEGVITDAAPDTSAPVTIVTQPSQVNLPLNLDLNLNGTHEGSEFFGNYDFYDYNQEITITWPNYPFESMPNASYRVSIRQYAYGEFYGGNNWTELKVSHHWATGQTPNSFTFGSFGYGEDVCFGCINVIVVEAETYTPVVSPYNNLVSGYTYTPVPLNGVMEGAAAFISEGELPSEPFVFEYKDRDARAAEEEEERGSEAVCTILAGVTGPAGGGGGGPQPTVPISEAEDICDEIGGEFSLVEKGGTTLCLCELGDGEPPIID